MKKMFFALAALVLAFTGCSQEDEAIQTNEQKAVKVVVNMDKPGFGEDTRAPRQGWEEGDVVGIILNDDFEHVLFLAYSGTAWESESFFLMEVPWSSEKIYNYDEDDDGNPSSAHQTQKAEYFSSIEASGSLKAIYCSSGHSYFDPIFEGGDVVGTKYVSNAGYDEENLMGECVMTCVDGTYSVNDDVLTLNITMKPQVAQFTIRDLAVGTNGKTSEGLEVAVAGGNLIAYAGGTITSSGIELNRVNDVGYYNACWVHHNDDGISIYASVDAGYEFTPNDTHYTFSVGDDCRNFDCATYKTKISNGAAIIMDGPETSGAEDKWAPGE